MTLLVVDPDDASSSALTDSLSQLGFSVSRISAAWRSLPSGWRSSAPNWCCARIARSTRIRSASSSAILAHDPTLPVAHRRARAISTRPRCLRRCGSASSTCSKSSDRIDLARRSTWRLAVAAHRALASTTARRTRARARSCASFNATSARVATSRWACCRRVRWRSIVTGCRHKLYPSLMLSGDFVDYFRITDRHFAFYMADVSGSWCVVGVRHRAVEELLASVATRISTQNVEGAGRNSRGAESRTARQSARQACGSIHRRDRPGRRYARVREWRAFPGRDSVRRRGLSIPRSVGQAGRFVRRCVVAIEAGNACKDRCRSRWFPTGCSRSWVRCRSPKRNGDCSTQSNTTHSKGAELWQVLGLEQRDAGPDDIACLVITKEA